MKKKKKIESAHNRIWSDLLSKSSTVCKISRKKWEKKKLRQNKIWSEMKCQMNNDNSNSKTDHQFCYCFALKVIENKMIGQSIIIIRQCEQHSECRINRISTNRCRFRFCLVVYMYLRSFVRSYVRSLNHSLSFSLTPLFVRFFFIIHSK